MKATTTATDLLKAHKLKLTKPRELVASKLLESGFPLSAEDIFKKLKGNKINNVTVYRTLASFESKGIVRQVDLRKGSVCYELAGDHHHHIVCRSCGDIEDFHMCLSEDMLKKVQNGSKKFKKIQDHSLEFFGLCKKCA